MDNFSEKRGRRFDIDNFRYIFPFSSVTASLFMKTYNRKILQESWYHSKNNTSQNLTCLSKNETLQNETNAVRLSLWYYTRFDTKEFTKTTSKIACAYNGREIIFIIQIPR